ncbi:hypothetical protein Ocin01_18557, partial [Orchesella cincta]
RRPSARNRKPVNNQRDKIPNPVKRLDQAVGSPLSSDSSNGAKTPKPTESFETLLAAHTRT